MAVIVPVTNGKVEETTTSSTSSTTKSGSDLGKEEFLQLLVAQMQYQDPLEPMDNSEYVAQLATFSQLEELQNMEGVVQNVQGTQLLGKQVVLHTTNAAGNTTEITGYVDYTTVEGNTTYLGINGSLYSVDDLYMVLDDDYLNAASIASSFSNLMAALPSVDDLTLDNADTLSSIRAAYDALSAYQKSFISSDDLQKLTDLEEKMAQLQAAAEEQTDTEEQAAAEEQVEENV